MSKLTFDDFVGNEGAVQKARLLIDEAVNNTHGRIPDMA